jgi:phosphoribosylformylglycinamidine synthase
MVVKPNGKPDYAEILDRLLRSSSIASKEHVVRIYDHEVQGGTIIKPLTGVMHDGPSDACILKPIGTHGKTALVLANGINPEYGKLDPYQMAWSVVDEAIRNAVAVGADPDRIALLDNFCWGDPKRPETLGSLVEAARGCHDAALAFRTPFISGKDSLNNEYLGSDGKRHAIPPTLLISSIGLIPNFEQAVTMEFKEAGNAVYLAGCHQPVCGGSYLRLLYPDLTSGYPENIPSLPLQSPRLYRLLHQAIRKGWVRACHDLSEGGLAVAAAEMCIGGRLGFHLNLESDDVLLELFGESNGCLLVEVAPGCQNDFETLLSGQSVRLVGEIQKKPDFRAMKQGRVLFDCPLSALITAWKCLVNAEGAG